MTTIKYGRTVSKNYQSEHAEVSLDYAQPMSDQEIEVELASIKRLVNSFLGVKEDVNNA